MSECVKNYSSPRISSEFKDCSLPLTFDQSNSCSFGCKYCFNAQFKLCNPAYAGQENTIKHVNYNHLNSVFRGEKPNNPYYDNFIKNRFVFHWGGLNDPFCYFERKHGVGLKIIENLADLRYPTLFSTKGLSLFLENTDYMKVFENNSKFKNFAFQFSIVAGSDELSNLIEPHTPVTTERLKAMKAMSDLGYYTVLRLRPFIIGITDIGLEDLLTRAKQAGAMAISTEFFALDKKIIDLLGKKVKDINDIIGFDIVEYYRNVSPTERGSYMRCNRDVKEPFMKRLYVKCKELGLQVNISDPDFKELNDSGCCCGMPYEFPDNPEMTNWSKGQLTEAILNARKRYWASNGEDCHIKFERDIDSKASNNWYSEYRYYGDSIKRWSTDYSVKYRGHKQEYIESWNNLRSPDNPYRYFMGLLKPVTIENDFIVYKYNPQPYELRWRKEGILK